MRICGDSLIQKAFVRTYDNYWNYFFYTSCQTTGYPKLNCDNYGQKWGSVQQKVFVYNDNGTIEDKSDDQYKVITTSIGNGNLPNQEVYSLANDLDGNIWVGLKKDLCFYLPSLYLVVIILTPNK